MGKYTTLSKTTDVLYTPECPVAIIANALVKDNETNKIFVQLKLKNISDNIVQAVKVEIIPFSVEGKEIKDRTEAQYLDITASYDNEFGQKHPIFLPDNTARSYKIICKTVICSNEKWENTANSVAEIIDFPQGIKMSINNTANFTKFIEYANNEEIKAHTNIFWQKHNKDEITSQRQYLIDSKTFISSDLKTDVDSLIEKYNVLLTVNRKPDDDFSADELETLTAFDELKNRIEEEKQVFNKKKSKKNKKIITIICTILIISIPIFTFISAEIKYNKALSIAEMYSNSFDNEYLEKMISSFDSLGSYKDSESYLLYAKAREAEYTSVIEAYDYYKSISNWVLDAKTRLKFIEEHVIPYTGTFCSSDGQSISIDFTLDSDKNIYFEGEQIRKTTYIDNNIQYFYFIYLYNESYNFSKNTVQIKSYRDYDTHKQMNKTVETTLYTRS